MNSFPHLMFISLYVKAKRPESEVVDFRIASMSDFDRLSTVEIAAHEFEHLLAVAKRGICFSLVK